MAPAAVELAYENNEPSAFIELTTQYRYDLFTICWVYITNLHLNVAGNLYSLLFI
jgi:hypothetical protein